MKRTTARRMSPPKQRATAPGGCTFPDGFTLMELLVTLAILLVLTVIVIPNLSGVKMQANQNAAMSSLKSIYQAEVAYEMKYPANGFACTLSTLGGDPRALPPSPQKAELLPNALASGRKNGYTYTIVRCTTTVKDRQPQLTGFEVTAVPEVVGKTGHFGYCLDSQGATKFDPAGGTNCTENAD
jgi:type IV pilus assembly protein PilA